MYPGPREGCSPFKGEEVKGSKPMEEERKEEAAWTCTRSHHYYTHLTLFTSFFSFSIFLCSYREYMPRFAFIIGGGGKPLAAPRLWFRLLWLWLWLWLLWLLLGGGIALPSRARRPMLCPRDSDRAHLCREHTLHADVIMEDKSSRKDHNTYIVLS